MITTPETPAAKQIFKNELFNNFANELLNNGFTIIIPSDPSAWNYMHFSKNNNIGYCQLGHFKYGISFSTVHLPNSIVGTGFGLDDSYSGIENATVVDAEKSFVIYPNWAKPDERKHVRKYKNLEDFLKNKLNQGTVITPNN